MFNNDAMCIYLYWCGRTYVFIYEAYCKDRPAFNEVKYGEYLKNASTMRHRRYITFAYSGLAENTNLCNYIIGNIHIIGANVLGLTFSFSITKHF